MKYKILHITIVATLILLFSSHFSNAALRTASVSGNWSSTATWGGASVPTSADDVRINGNITVTVNVANAQCASLTYLSSNNRTTTVTISGSNSLVISGLLSMPRPNNGATSTLNVNAGTVTADELTMGATVSGRNNVINITTGTFTVIDAITTGTTGCQITFSGAGTFNMEGNLSGSPALTTVVGSTVNYTGSENQTIYATTYNGNLGISGTGTKVIVASTTVNGTLFLTNGVLVNNTFLTMANGSIISRSEGILWSTPTFAGIVNLIYTGSSPVTTGFEVPTSADVLNNLTTNTGGVIQGGIPVAPTNILTDQFANLTNWVGDIGTTYNQFTSVASTNAGGAANEGRYAYGSSATTIYTASIYRSVNTAGYTSININWKQFIDNYDPITYPYTVKVQCAASSGGPWTDIYSLSPTSIDDIGPETKAYYNWTTNVGGTFYVRYYITGYTYGLDYWYFDDLVIEANSTLPPTTSTVTVNGNFDLTNGTYSIASNTLALNGALTGNNVIIGSTVSNLHVTGGGSNLVLPAITNGLNNFTINRTNGARLSGNVTVNDTTTLSGGILTNGAFLTIADGTTISRSQGSLGSEPTFAGIVNLLYTGSSPILTGYETPSSAGILNNLTTNPGGVIQGGVPGPSTNILTDEFANLTNWVGSTGASYNQFSSAASSYAGGTANEGRYAYGESPTTIYTTSIYRAVNTTGYNSLNIRWKQFINNYDPVTYPYTIKVQCSASTDGPWTDIYSLSPTNSNDIGPEEKIYTNWPSHVGGTFYIRYYITGYTYGLDYWYFDDLVIEGQSTTIPTTVTVNGTLSLSSGTYSIAANSLVLNGEIASGNTIIGSSESNLAIGGSGANLALPTITDGLKNFTISRASGATMNTDLTVVGVLNMPVANPLATKGSLDMWDGSNVKTLTMGANATTVGQGDVTGVVKRTTFVPNISYSFGNQKTTAIFPDWGTLPTEISMKIRIGAELAWRPGAIKREIEIIQTGGSGTKAVCTFVYLDSELNGNVEEKLVLWTKYFGLEYGRSAYNTDENWVAISNVNVGFFSSSFDETKNFTLDEQSDVSTLTWNGSVSDSWTTAENWTPNAGPSFDKNIIIPNATTTPNDPILPSFTEVKSLTMQAEGVLNSEPGAELTINGAGGAWSNLGGTFNHSSSNVIFTNADATISGTTNFYNVTIADAGGLIPTDENVMRIANALTLEGTGVLRAAFLNNTIEYNGADQTVINPNGLTPGYYKLILSGSGTKTMPITALSILDSLSIAGSSYVTADSDISVGGNATFGLGTTFNLGLYNHTFAGNITNNGGTIAPATSTLTLNGSEQQTITSSGGIDLYNLAITNTSADITLGSSTNCSIGGDLTIDTGSVFNLAANSITTLGGSVANSGTVKTQSTSAAPVPAGKTWGGYFEYTGINAQTIVAGTYNNLTFSGIGGATAAANITVNGILNLASANPSSSKGILDMDSYTVLMGPSATTIGPGDVIGIIKRTTLLPNITYSFGSQYTTIYFPNVGTLPSEMSVMVSIGTAPLWKTGGINRIYDIIQTGGIGTQALIYSHYLDSELNGNSESSLVFWVNIFAGPTLIEYGRSAFNSTENWVAISNVNVSFYSSVFGEKKSVLAESLTLALTWNGSVSTSWVTADNWTPNGAPSDQTAITIPDAATTNFDPTIPAIATCSTIEIESGAILNSNAGAQLTIVGGAGAWSIAGGTFNSGTSTIVFTNSSATMAGSTDFYNMTINTGAAIALQTNTYLGIVGTLSNNGTLATVDNGATTVEYKGVDQTVVDPDRSNSRYSTLILSGSGTKTMPTTALTIEADFSMSGTATTTAGAALTIGGNVTVGNGTTFVTENYNHSIGGNFNNSGTFTATAGSTITMNGSSAQAMAGTATTTFDNLTIANINGINLSANVNVNNVLALSSGNLSVGSTTLGINGTISKTSGNIEVTTLSSLNFGGTSAITLNSDLFTTPPSINNLTINRSGGVTLGNQNMTVNGLLDLPSGTFSLGANTLTIAGSSPTRTSGFIDASDASATLVFINTAAITLPASIFTGNVNNLTINGTGGTTAISDFTVNGILNLQSANPSATKGSLDMWDGSAIKTLTMGANATTIGLGDVTGIVNRTSFAANTSYTFGNQFTSLTFTLGGTYPSQVQVKISIGSEPAWKTDAIKRTYDIIQTGESGSFLSMSLYYLDAELNGNSENLLVHWDGQLPSPPGEVMEHGKFNYDVTNNWVGCSNMEGSYFPSSFDSMVWTLGNSALSNFTWNGSVSTDWSTAANWTPVGNPSSLNMVVIPNATTTPNDPTLPSLAGIGNMTIEEAGILNSEADAQLTLNGNSGAWINIGGTFNPSTSNVIFTDPNATISGTTNFYDITLNSGAGLAITSESIMRIEGVLTNNGTLNTITGGTTTVEYNGGDQTIIIPNPATNRYSNLILSGSGIKTMPTSALEILGDFLMAGTTTTTLTSSMTVDGNLTIESGNNLLVSPVGNLTVSGTLANNAGNAGFVLQSDATGTATLIHNTDNVLATVERYISGIAEDWHFLSSPVSNQSISGSWLPSGTYGNGTGYDLYLWDEPNSCWVYNLDVTSALNWNMLHPGANFEVSRGYLYSVQALNPTKEFSGYLNNGPLDYRLTISSTDVGVEGFNLIGNPYPSSVDWSAASGWTRTNLDVSGGGYNMWIWNPAASNYGVFNSADGDGVGTNSVTQFIAPMQGFFVQAGSAGNLGMDNDVRINSGASNWLKSSKYNGDKNEKVAVTVTSESGNGFDEIQLRFGSSENENGAKKLYSKVPSAPSLYMNSGSDNISVRYFTNTNENPVVPIQFTAGAKGNFTFSCNFDPFYFETVILEDRKTQGFHNLKANSEYSFYSSPSDDANRFVLYFGPVNSSSEVGFPARIYTSNYQLVVDLSLVSGDTETYVYDIMGRLLLHQKLQGETLHNLNLNAQTQIVIVSLKNLAGELNQKVFWSVNK